jgi:hydrogenase nickel incorporation protein HypA/HybF
MAVGFPMHEWALAESVISTVSQIAKKEGLKEVTEVKIVVGELQQIELDIFEFALSQLKKPELEKAKFKIAISKAQLRCRVCGNKWVFEKGSLSNDNAEAIHFLPEVAHTYIRCPNCGSPDFEVLEGRGIWLKSIRGVK